MRVRDVAEGGHRGSVLLAAGSLRRLYALHPPTPLTRTNKRSYHTHPPGTVSAMNRLLRDEFVALHTASDLLQDLAAQLRESYPGIQLPEMPRRGSLDVTRVKRSRYFFS